MGLMRRAFVLLYLVVAAACSSPTAPTRSRISGTWEGTYRISRAEPANCGNVLGCPASPTVTLTLEQSGDSLSGVLQLHQGARFEVKGRVVGAEVTLFSDPAAVTIPCTGRPTAVGETRLASWSTRLVGGNALVGAFTSHDFRLFNVGGANLCPSGTITIVAEDVRLSRVS